MPRQACNRRAVKHRDDLIAPGNYTYVMLIEPPTRVFSIQ